MLITGKEGYVSLGENTIRFLNQRSCEWTHPYEYPAEPGANLKNAGCGVFSACIAAEVMSGKRICVEDLADFSCREGGRGNDGTDRPALLTAMERAGLTREYGFTYDGLGLRNDHEALWETLCGGGAALCNLRRGHIVCLVGCRIKDGERQVLAVDPHSESADSRVTDHVREILPASRVVSPVYNASGVLTGYQTTYGVFWVPLTLPSDFNLLHPVS